MLTKLVIFVSGKMIIDTNPWNRFFINANNYLVNAFFLYICALFMALIYIFGFLNHIFTDDINTVHIRYSGNNWWHHR